jgi:adenosine deaminase
MRKTSSLRVLPGKIAFTLTALLTCALTLSGQPDPSTQLRQPGRSGSPEQRTARYFETIRKSPPQQLAFLLRMPKGADLHNHLSGSIYAERYIEWAAANGLCINTANMTLSVPPADSNCDPKSGQPPASTALTNAVLYRQLVDAWSMRNWQLSGQSGHDHFFDAFGKFGPATYNQNGAMLAELVKSAARGHVLYVEVMLTPDGTPTGVMSSQIGSKVGWDGNSLNTLNKLKSNGIADAAATGIKNLQDMEADKDELLKCGTPDAQPGCSVTVRYIAQVARNGAPGPVFAQMVTGFTLANDPNSRVVGLNLVQAEDGLNSMQNSSLHMQMLNFLRSVYPQARVTLHAGELAPGIVPPEGLTSHIRESVMTARAERIGHGVDIMHESEPYELLKEMARRNVLVEICLSSNDVILGISGSRHPLLTYMKYGVPVALATDDEGVARSEISLEFLKAVEEHALGYLQLKTMVRNSLQHAFITGASLWNDGRKFVPVTQCSQDFAAKRLSSNACRQYIDGSEKAKLQWRLEVEFSAFERQW